MERLARKYVDAARKALGLPDEHYFVSQEVRLFCRAQKKLLADYEKLGTKPTTRGARKILIRRKLLDDGVERRVPADLSSKIPDFPKDAKLATRKAGGEVLQPIAQAMPLLMSGSADLYGSTMNYIEGGGDFNRDDPGGRNIRFGIREHGMCAILNGISYHGLFRASGATFAVFHRLLPRLPFGWPRWQSFPILTFSLMTRSVSVKTVPLMNPWRR